MLQMINIDGTQSKSKEHSDNENLNLNNSANLENKLPRIQSNKSNYVRNKGTDWNNMSTIDYVKTEIEPEYDDTNGPKV